MKTPNSLKTLSTWLNSSQQAAGAVLSIGRCTDWSQAFGTISRRWTETGGGRWRYNFSSAIAANTEVMRAMQRAGEHDLAAVLQARIRAFRRLHWVQEISRLRAEGAAPTRLARQILSHPSIWPLVVQRGARRAAKALCARSPMRA